MALADEANRATRLRQHKLTRHQRRVNQLNDRIILPQRDQHVADRKPTAPDWIDHRMIGASGAIGRGDRGIGAEMPGQFERQLHAGEYFAKRSSMPSLK